MQLSISWHQMTRQLQPKQALFVGQSVFHNLSGCLSYRISSLMKSCAQATFVENCFSNLGNKYSTVARNIHQQATVQCKVHMVCAISTWEVDATSIQSMFVSLFVHQGRSTQDIAILDSSQCNNALWKTMKEILLTKIYYKEQVQKVISTILVPLMLECYVA